MVRELNLVEKQSGRLVFFCFFSLLVPNPTDSPDCDTGHVNRSGVPSTGCEITQTLKLPHSVAGAALVIRSEQLWLIFLWGGAEEKKGRQTAFVEANGYNVHNSAWSLRAARCTWEWLGMKMRRAPLVERSVFFVPMIFMSLSVKIVGNIGTSGMWCSRGGHDWKLWKNQPWQCVTNPWLNQGNARGAQHPGSPSDHANIYWNWRLDLSILEDLM